MIVLNVSLFLVVGVASIVRASVTTPFPDGTIKCTTFPSSYGPIPEYWLNNQGWTGLQKATISNGVVTSAANLASGGNCAPGDYCSYACPEGYLKTQWPVQTSAQPVGGLYCNPEGLLQISNHNFTTLCTAGAGSATVGNSLSQNVCICGTDYPGKHTVANLLPLILTIHRKRRRVYCQLCGSWLNWLTSNPERKHLLSIQRHRNECSVLHQPCGHARTERLYVWH